MCAYVIINIGSANNQLCYPPDSQLFQSAVYRRTAGAVGTDTQAK